MRCCCLVADVLCCNHGRGISDACTGNAAPEAVSRVCGAASQHRLHDCVLVRDHHSDACSRCVRLSPVLPTSTHQTHPSAVTIPPCCACRRLVWTASVYAVWVQRVFHADCDWRHYGGFRKGRVSPRPRPCTLHCSLLLISVPC